MQRLYYAVSLSALVLLCAGCAAETATVDDPCLDNETCGDHGACLSDAGVATCVCVKGYTGATCETCQDGYELDGAGSCVLIVGNAGCAAGDCGLHGVCNELTSPPSCICEDGYTGAYCNTCDIGFLPDHNGGCVASATCLTDQCSQHGSCDDTTGMPICTCDEGYLGERCQYCADGYLRKDASCIKLTDCVADDPCGHGTCDDSRGFVTCLCDPGFGGDLCSSCAAGYHDDGAGACQLDERCGANTCSGSGSCDDTSGMVSCICAGNTDGTWCEVCASGFHRLPSGGCVADETCGGVDCGSHGTCAVVAGLAHCTCDTGWVDYQRTCMYLCEDLDADGYGDGPSCAPDNCPSIANPGQEDSDSDGIGDACSTITDYVWSRDASRIAWVQCAPDTPHDCALWTSDPHGIAPRLVTTGVASHALNDYRNGWLLIQPDSTPGNPPSYDGEGEFYVISDDGTGLTQVTFTYTDGIKTTNNPVWTNLGTAVWARFVTGAPRVYFLANDGNGWFQTYLCNDDGTDGWSSVSSPHAWYGGASSGSSEIVYGRMADYNAPATLFALDAADVSAQTQLRSGAAVGLELAISPDGGTLAYTQLGVGGGADIRLIGTDASSDRALMEDTFNNMFWGFIDSTGQPRTTHVQPDPWSADGALLVFGSDRDGDWNLYSVASDGTGLTQLTSDASTYEYSGSISPDSRFVAYMKASSTVDVTAWPYPATLVVERR